MVTHEITTIHRAPRKKGSLRCDICFIGATPIIFLFGVVCFPKIPDRNLGRQAGLQTRADSVMYTPPG